MVPPKSCKEIKAADSTKPSGLYTIASDDARPFKAFCDMQSLRDGGWTVIMRRVDGSVSFSDKKWGDYKTGFGNIVNGNFWIGLENMNALTTPTRGRIELWIGLKSHFPVFPPRKASDVYKFALYNNFRVGNKDSQYQLTISGYDQSSTAGDSLSSHNGAYFSTPDKDNDGLSMEHEACAKKYKSGWWFHNCHDSNLSGTWRKDGGNGELDGIVWETFMGDKYSLKNVIMAVRSVAA